MGDRSKPEPRNHAPTPEIKLPEAIAEEKLVLGAILSGTPFSVAADLLAVHDLSLESHRRIWLRMSEVAARGVPCDRVVIANELKAHGQLESVSYGALGGLAYLASLGDEIPAVESLTAYANIVKSRSLERQLFTLNRRFAKGILSGTLDIRQALDSLGAEVQKLQDEAAAGDRNEGKSTEEVILEYPGGLPALLDPSLRPQGWRTCYSQVDDKLGGFMPGQLLVLSGRTASGKTAWALNVVHNFIFQDPPIPSAIFSFEMPPSALINRLISTISGVAAYRIRNNFLNADERRRMAEAVGKLQDAPLRFAGQEAQDINLICSSARKMVKAGIKFIVIDHLNLIDSTRAGNVNRAEEINRFTRRLKLLAMELQIPILLLCQLKQFNSKEVGRKPELEDLKDSSAISQDADIVMFTFRKWLTDKSNDDLKDKAELIIAKNRDGEIFDCPLIYNGSILKFLNAD